MLDESVEPGKTYLGFDYGTRRIGVAVGQDITSTARPLTILNCQQGEPDWQQCLNLINQWRPAALVVGIPYNDGHGNQTIVQEAKRFAEKLLELSGIPVYTTDERLTSAQARGDIAEGLYPGFTKSKKSKKPVDALAAQLILEQWLRQRKNKGNIE